MLTALALTLALASPARADVFVPADPAPRKADCRASGAGVATETHDGVVEVEEGGAWRRLRGIERCPWFASSPDGTAALLGDTRLSVRPPGGRFGAPVRVGGGIQADLAVNGGWVALARGGFYTAVSVTTVAPDGSRRTARVAGASPGEPRLGVDALGNVVVAWTTDEVEGYVLHVRGGPFGPGRAFPVERSFSAYAVAVSPAGRTVVAWADAEGVWASDGGDPVRLSAERDARSLTVSVNDGGAAVVAYADRRGRLAVVDRGPGGAWSLARVPPGQPRTPIPANEEGEVQPVTRSVLAHDGRAAVVWDGSGPVGERVFATGGVAGGAWTPATAVSPITREVALPVLTLDATAAPHVEWLEFERFRFRGATLAPGAESDTTAPKVKARRIGRAVRVTCSEACDVRVRVLRDGLERWSRVRGLRAGRTAVFRTRARIWRARLVVLATDRAGNVARRRLR